MKEKFTLFFLLIATLSARQVVAQATFQTSGNWNVASNWASNNIGDGGEDVTTNNNRTPTLVSGDNYTIGNMTAGADLDINSGATLTLGTSVLFNGGTDKSLTFNNNSTLTVDGNLEIWGDLIVNNSLTLNITGTMIVHGDVSMANGGELTVSGNGTLVIGGNLTGGNNTQITTSGDGTISVGGAISIGGGTSSITGPPGSITAGSCSCGACGGSCPNTVLPVELVYFQVKADEQSVRLNWATITEENFSKFIVQRATDGLDFQDIAEVPGQGRNIYDAVSEYTFEDKAPVLGYNFYRLKALDRDGRYEYFGLRSVQISGKKTLTVYPNPANGNAISFVMNFNPSEGDRVRIVNSLGKELYNASVRGNTITIRPPESLAPGVYLLQYAGSSFKETVRVVISK